MASLKDKAGVILYLNSYTERHCVSILCDFLLDPFVPTEDVNI